MKEKQNQKRKSAKSLLKGLAVLSGALAVTGAAYSKPQAPEVFDPRCPNTVDHCITESK